MINLTIFFRLYYAFVFIASLYLVVITLINLQKSRLKIFGLLTLIVTLISLSVLINLMSTSSLGVIYSQQLLYISLFFAAGLWLMFVFEMGHSSKNKQHRIINFYTLLISTFFTYLYFSSTETELFFVSFEVHKYYGLKLIEYNKTVLFDIFTVYNTILYFSTAVYCYLYYRDSKDQVKRFMINCGILSVIAGFGTIFDFFFFNLATTLFLPVYIIFGYIFNKSLDNFTFTGSNYGNIFDNLKEAILILDKKNRIVHCNSRAYIVFPELLTKNFPIDYAYVNSIPVMEILSKRLTKIKHILPSTSEKKIYNIHVNDLNLDLKYFDGKSIVFEDITELKNLQEKFATSTKYDYLTGIYNKMYFNRYGRKLFNQSLNGEMHFSLMLFDIDNFNEINSTYSAETGNKLLNDVVHIYEKMIKDYSIKTTSIFRLSGDSFAIIFIDISTEQTLSIADTYRTSISNTPIVSTTNVISYTISGGLEMLQMSNAITFEKLIYNAKEKLNHAKETGKNKIVYSNINR